MFFVYLYSSEFVKNSGGKNMKKFLSIMLACGSLFVGKNGKDLNAMNNYSSSQQENKLTECGDQISPENTYRCGSS